MKARFSLDITLHQNSEGRHYLQFQPILTGGCLSTGELKFAVYQAWLDEPQTHQNQQQKAIESAKQSLRAILAEVA